MHLQYVRDTAVNMERPGFFPYEPMVAEEGEQTQRPLSYVHQFPVAQDGGYGPSGCSRLSWTPH